MRLNVFLRSKRKEKGYSQLNLSKKLGYESSQFISNWERGLARPPLELLKNLCKALDIPKKQMKNALVNEYELKVIKALGMD